MRKLVVSSRRALCRHWRSAAPAWAQAGTRPAPGRIRCRRHAYGPRSPLDQAKKAVEAAEAEAKKNGWMLAIAVVIRTGGYLVQFSKMDNTQFASIQIAARQGQERRRPSAGRPRPSRTA